MSGNELVDWIGQRSIRAVVIIATGLLVVGFVLPLVTPTNAGWWSLLGQTRSLFWGLALFLIVVAGGFALRRFFGDQLLESSVDLGELTWEQFEDYVAAYFQRRSGKVTYRGGAKADGGVDLVVEDERGRRLVQCKHWKLHSVGVKPVRELWGVVEHEHADGAVMVTSGTYSADAWKFARGKAYELIDGPRLDRLVREVKAARVRSAKDARASDG
jgi:restriction system protein